MSSFGRDDRDLHDAKGGHLSTTHRHLAWRTRMEAHLELHVRRDSGRRRPVEDRADRWDLGTHIPRQLRTPLAES